MVDTGVERVHNRLQVDPIELRLMPYTKKEY
jgi:hypothetical protein